MHAYIQVYTFMQTYYIYLSVTFAELFTFIMERSVL